MILKDISTIGHGIKTHCKDGERCDELKDYNCLSFKVTEKGKTLPFLYWILKCIRSQ